MKLFDSIGLVLKSKDENRVLSVEPDQSVYEAIAKDGRAWDWRFAPRTDPHRDRRLIAKD
jgi:hypothetical protein